MKIITEEEKRAHNRSTQIGGIKGLALGTGMSLCVFALAPRYFPRLFKLPYSIRTAVFVIPPAFAASVNAELCSQEFDRDMYSSDLSQWKTLEDHRNWEKLSFVDKSVQAFSTHKYQIITGLWGLSMWGSWVYVNRDPLLTRTQKFVTARMYAQFLTVGLLLASIGLSMYEENHHLNKKKMSEDNEYLQEVIALNEDKDEGSYLKDLIADEKKEVASELAQPSKTN